MVDAPKLTKGRIVGMSTGIVRYFMFNPTEVRITGGWIWGRESIPLRSHDHRLGGAGSGELVEFTLWFDGDRGRIANRPRFVDVGTSTADPNVPVVPLDVMPEINTFRSIVLPHDADLGEAYGTPDTFLLSMGTVFNGLVKGETTGLTVLEWTKDLGALRATLDLVFGVVERTNVTDWIFINREVANALTEDPEVIPVERA